MVAVRAIRFEGAGNQQIRPDAGAGPLLTPGRRLAFVAGPEAIRQSILLLLTTAPGERVMRP
ncbi:GPW/gp25 family protein, partial [Polymorphobacter multimanifer]